MRAVTRSVALALLLLGLASAPLLAQANPPQGYPPQANPPPPSGYLGTLSVDLPVDLTPSDTRQRYELMDDIVLRNTTRP